jgi:(2Fe-2S) ferredoxin
MPSGLPLFDVWVCQGRMCTANGSDAVAARARELADLDRCRVLRGGCFGLCEIGPNVVVRRHVDQLPDPDADRLSLTQEDNETVYSGIQPADVGLFLRAHIDNDSKIEDLTREAREAALPPASPVAAKLRELREKRKRA